MLVAVPALIGCLILYMISTFLRPYEDDSDPSESLADTSDITNDNHHPRKEKPPVIERLGEEMGNLARSISFSIILTPIILIVIGFLLYGLLTLTNRLFPMP